MLTTAQLQQKISGITDEKMCKGISDESLIINAKKVWDEAGGFEPSKNEDPEWKFWWELLAYRYANLRMRKIDGLEDLQCANELFKVISTSLNGHQDITYIKYISGIYRLAVLSRIKAMSPKDNDIDGEISKIWRLLVTKKSDFFADNGNARIQNPIETSFHNLLELSSYFLDLESSDIRGRHTFFTLPVPVVSKSNAYKILHSKNGFSDIRYPLQVAKEIACSEEHAIVYQLDSLSSRNNEDRADNARINGTWLTMKNKDLLRQSNPPEKHSLEFLTRIIYKDQEIPLPDKDNSRQVKRRLNTLLTRLTSCNEPLLTRRGLSTQLNPDMEESIIGVVHISVFEMVYEYDPDKPGLGIEKTNI